MDWDSNSAVYYGQAGFRSPSIQHFFFVLFWKLGNHQQKHHHYLSKETLQKERRIYATMTNKTKHHSFCLLESITAAKTYEENIRDCFAKNGKDWARSQHAGNIRGFIFKPTGLFSNIPGDFQKKKKKRKLVHGNKICPFVWDLLRECFSLS